jgi:protein-disulfide isomerase
VVKASTKSSTSTRAFYLIIAAIAVAGVAALTYLSTRPKNVATVSPIDTTLPKVESHGYVMGSPNAPLEITEFGDFECPACGTFALLTEPEIRKRYVDAGQVRWRFIDDPLPMHRNTWQASRAAACADEQGKFWAFHDMLYQTQDQWNGEATGDPDKFMKQYARQLGLDTQQFDQCVDSKKFQAKIQAHAALAEQRKVTQTPTFLVGTQQVAGAQPYDVIAKTINEELAKAGAKPGVGGDTSKAATVQKPGS